jgi:hypothetical protein
LLLLLAMSSRFKLPSFRSSSKERLDDVDHFEMSTPTAAEGTQQAVVADNNQSDSDKSKVMSVEYQDTAFGSYREALSEAARKIASDGGANHTHRALPTPTFPFSCHHSPPTTTTPTTIGVTCYMVYLSAPLHHHHVNTPSR